ncbi:DNA mismatch repair endonuclease MutL [Gallaecimonas mangrovi]|uniref:DNA mismatch repair endonuclease MutL n=1 Tax=Gallaecimonas mangrovi TaxID=2291597 RepID=UPI000E1FC7B3|nr:DNA mismatch repair endonuclease MutL [Gallaecimonas mangrovi]
MPIRILPARLANQIAAGEVVERPASVVKELVENSIDAGASRIEIDIDKGGQRLIRVRDNGSGIPKDELTLALSRHATSKIATLDDLEAIFSLGFRGEALASVSSVSRLTLTSRTMDASEAWAAQAEGREMEVTVTPAAHPVGTTVEVHDLFFNTPARRKFLRAEKTEFAHIDELVRRIALSKMDVGLVLRHNGKVMRQYPAANAEQALQRLAVVCGQEFGRHCLAIDNQHQQLRLWGWISEQPRNHPDLQYCYVNGRMMRDKLINHAVKEAYGPLLGEGQHGAYVLFVELPANAVDVNVHPAKHEVRFHDARLVHDFIGKALSDALAQVVADAAVAFSGAGVGEERLPDAHSGESHFAGRATGRQGYQASAPASRQQVSEALDAFARWQAPVRPAPVPEAAVSISQGDTPIHLERGRWLILSQKAQLMAADLLPIGAQKAADLVQKGAASQPLLLPVNIPVDEALIDSAQQHQAQLEQWGIALQQPGKGRLMVKAVPEPLRELDVSHWLLPLLAAMDNAPLKALSDALAQLPRKYRWQEAMALWQGLDHRQQQDALVPLDLHSLLKDKV